MVDGRSTNTTEGEIPEFTSGMGSYGMLAGEIRPGGHNIVREGLCRHSDTFRLESQFTTEKDCTDNKHHWMVNEGKPKKDIDNKFVTVPLKVFDSVIQHVNSTQYQIDAKGQAEGRETVSDGYSTYNSQAAMSMDGMFAPYSTAFGSGIRKVGKCQDGTIGTQYDCEKRNPSNKWYEQYRIEKALNPYDSYYKHHGYDVNITASGMPNFEYPTTGGLDADSMSLNPLGSGHGVQFAVHSSGIKHIDGYETKDSLAGKTDDYRAMGVRMPLVLVGWGYDTEGNPVPNASLDADPVRVDASWKTISPLNVDKSQFVDSHMQRPNTWKAGPLDVRWDRARKVWVGGGGADIRLIMATRCQNFAGNESPYDTCSAGNASCCMQEDESGMGIPEPPMYGGLVPEFATCCPTSRCRYRQCAVNMWSCSDCDNVSAVVTKATSSLSKADGVDTVIEVDDVNGVSQAHSGGHTIHVRIGKNLDDMFADNPELKPKLPNIGPAGTGYEVVKIKKVTFTDPKCRDPKCPGQLIVGPSSGTAAGNRGMGAPKWQGCPQTSWNPCTPAGAGCGGTFTEDELRMLGCASEWTAPFYVVGPSIAYSDGVVIRKPAESANGFSTDVPPDWEGGTRETSTSSDPETITVENVMLHSIKRGKYFYGLNTGRIKSTIVRRAAGTNPAKCNNNSDCGQTGKDPCCCESSSDRKYKSAFNSLYGTGCPPYDILREFPVYWIMQAEFEQKQVATKVTCDPNTFELTICTRNIPVEGGASCEYCPGVTTCLSGDETVGVSLPGY